MNDKQTKELNIWNKSRTEYSAKNTTVAMFARIMAIVMGFTTRVVFTHTLSEAYVGINGLFTDILNVLALSELGIGTAITYALYKPISQKDIEKQKSLMHMYKIFYRIVALLVLGIGLLLIPFLGIFVEETFQIENLILLYVLYLANSVVSYLLIYKRTLLDAYQLSYIGVVCQTVFLVIQNVLQVIILLKTKNFLLFVLVLLICTLCNNVTISIKANRLFPFLKEKNVAKLDKEEKNGIYRNIRAMLMHKVGNVVVTNTDNLLLSSLVGIVSVGIYSNYFLVIGSVRQVLNQAFQGITASVGNLGTEGNKERVRHIFETAFFIGQWMFGFAVICLYEILPPFVEISFGPQYLFSKEVTWILCINFYLTGMRQATLVFRDSLGLFWYDRFKSVAEAVINLVVSLFLGYYMGVAGVFLGTLVSTVTTSLWVEPFVLYKYKLQVPVRFYFFKYIKYVVITGLAWVSTDYLCKLVSGPVFKQCFLKLLLCMIVPNIIYLLSYLRAKEFRAVLDKIKVLYQSHKKKQTHTTAKGVEFSLEEQYLLQCLSKGLMGHKALYSDMERAGWEKLVSMAQKHGVQGILYNTLQENGIPEDLEQLMERKALQTVVQQYRLLFLTKYIVKKLEQEKIEIAVLKGVTIGAYYPVPELRKSGDIDLLLLQTGQVSKAVEIMKAAGFVCEESIALHHLSFSFKGSISIEMHTMLVEPFDNEKANAYLRRLLEKKEVSVIRKEIMGIELPVLSDPFFAFELLLHMLQHFLRSGFGLKLLCDWVAFWEEKGEFSEKEQYMKLICEIGVKDFADLITNTCVQYLGLDREKIEWMACRERCPTDMFMQDVFRAEEFGKSDNKRMVVLRGNKKRDFIREFHHQMCLNFPRESKVFLMWPVLWLITLFRFLDNNRKLRKVSTMEILREVKRRSRMMEELKLFK